MARDERQQNLFGAPPPPPEKTVGPAAVADDLQALADRLSPRIRLGTSSWSFPGWEGIVFDRKASTAVLARRGLGAYARHPLLRAVGCLFGNPQMRAFLRDSTYLRRITFLLDRFSYGEDPIFYRAPTILFIHSRALIPTPLEDSILAAYNIVLAAETLGLGSCFVSLAQNAMNSSRALKQIAGLDPRDRVHAVVVVGYPSVRFHRPIPRRPVAAARL